MTRDSQRQKLYDAENSLRRMIDTAVEIGNPVITVAGVTLTLPPEARFASIESIQTYVDRVRALPFIEATYPRAGIPVSVRARQGDAKAHYENARAVIAIPDNLGSWAMREVIVLHELAHHLAWGDGHGSRFAAAFLDLLGTVLGPEVELAQRIIFDQHEVSYRPQPVPVG
jgi:putative metallohydrolase (TIGR04338 family)